MTNPATQEVVNRVPETTADEFEEAVASAHAAFPGWADTPVPTRQRVMFRFLELIKQHKDELALNITTEQGKTVSDAHGDIFRGMEVLAARLHWTALLHPLWHQCCSCACQLCLPVVPASCACQLCLPCHL